MPHQNEMPGPWPLNSYYLLLTSPETTLTRLARVASTNTSQASLLLSAFSAQPGIVRMQMGPHEPPRMLMEIACLLHKPPAELKGFHAGSRD